jgi:isopropylmalate/homocitrate/citramalate synthase
MKKYLMMALMVTSTLLVATSCGTSKQVASSAVSVTDRSAMAKQLGEVAEVEIALPCSGVDSDEEFLRVNGDGKSKDRSMSKDKAYQAALANLAAKLEGVMSMENQKVGVSINADGEEFHDKTVAVSKLIAKANVAGFRTSCEKYTRTPGDPSYSCYVTIEFGKQKMVKQLYEALNKEKVLKADYDYDRYLEAFNKDLKAYEESR